MKELAVDGNYIRDQLKRPPSGSIGKIKRVLWDACVLNPELNKRSVLRKMIRTLGRRWDSIPDPARGAGPP